MRASSSTIKQVNGLAILFIFTMICVVFSCGFFLNRLTGRGWNLSRTSAVSSAKREGSIICGSNFNRDLVLYVFKETLAARRNLKFFLTHGIHAKVDYIFIMQGETRWPHDTYIPSGPNIRVISRNNSCFDLGTHKQVLSSELIRKYSRFILMNASIRGPFLPIWSRELWTDLFFRRLSDVVKMVGLTVNCQPVKHVQSMLLAFDREGLHLILPVLYCYDRKEDAILHGELKLTGAIMDAGYSVDVMMTSFHSSTDYLRNCSHDNPFVEGSYFGLAGPQPYETVFVKSNTKWQRKLIDKYTAWHDNIRRRSHEE